MADVSIVGGGPAGAYTGYIAKKLNPDLEVTIYDARKRIGYPVNCAAGIVTFWLKRLGIKLPDRVIRQRLKGLRIVGPDGREWTHHQDDIGEDKDVGVVMDRREFDQWQLDRAKKVGVEVQLGVNPARWDTPYEFNGSRYIIGADGWKSSLGTHHGFDTKVSDLNMHIGYEHRVKMPEYDQDYITFYIGNKWAPSGYVWIFPEGNGVVKVGLGIPKAYNKRPEHAIRSCLRRFLADFPEYDGERTEKGASGAGFIPTSKPINEFVMRMNDGSWVGLVGDAARMVDPLHGGGIATAMLAGRIAGQVIGNEKPLSDYQVQWDRKWRPEHMRRYSMKEALTQWGDWELNKMVGALGNFHFRTSDAPVEAGRMMLHMLKKEPAMFTKAVGRALASYATARF